MLEKNKQISLSGESALEALAELEYILISLHKIGSYYVGKSVDEYRRETTDFIDDERVTQRLAKIRRILSEPFDSAVGEDDMDDIERRVSKLEFWNP
ncbi:hypothetical protein SB766_02835 [Pseudomonas sp. SIMBA_077]